MTSLKLSIARKILAAALMSLAVLFLNNFYCQAAISNKVPKESFKTLPMAPESSVSTYVPSEACKNGGIAVTINYATIPRYKNIGMPVAVVIPGYSQASGLRFTMHAAQAGFVEVRFAFPGGGLKKFHSGGSWDLRGPDSQKALRDVILFAGGKIRDFKGRSLEDLVASTVNYDNLGLVGWHDGFNIAVITMVKFHESLNFIKWLVSYESPVGSLMLPSNLGTVKELNLNNHYRQGSAATGKIAIDYSNLAWQSDIFRKRTRRLKKKLSTPKGVLFFDDNENGRFDELTEFALNYAILPGLFKQIYAPEVTSAMQTSKTFVHVIDLDNLSEESFEDLIKEHPEVIEVLGSAKKPKPAVKKTDRKNIIEIEMWPETVASLSQSEAFYQERDASTYINRLAELYPNLLVTVFGSRIDHFEQQVDHPHIALLYNLFLASKLKWVRLNPERVYVGFTADMNPENFVSNKVKSPIDASNIKSHLESEGLIKDDLYIRASISELADRVKNKDFASPLEGVLEAYLNEAVIKKTIEQQGTLSQKEPSEKVKLKIIANLPYVAGTKSVRQQLDLYLPDTPEKKPLVLWIHGGGWNAGDKDSVLYRPLTKAGFAVASMNYRYSNQVKFPAQILDARQAIRWIRQHASEYNIDPERVGVWGVSSGGHLAALLGVTSGGGYNFGDRSDSKISTDVKAVCDWFGPADLAMLIKNNKESSEIVKLTKKLLGEGGDLLAKARAASPVNYVRKGNPPVLIMHGDEDQVVHMTQSRYLYNALKAKGVPAKLVIESGVGHGLGGFGSRRVSEVINFFKQNLK